MRVTNVFVIGLLAMSGCRNTPVATESAGPVGEPATFAPMIERLKLTPAEQAAFRSAAGQVKGAPDQAAHVHMDAANGHLTFTADREPGHAKPGEADVSAPGEPVRVLASPAANELLRQRTGH